MQEYIEYIVSIFSALIGAAGGIWVKGAIEKRKSDAEIDQIKIDNEIKMWGAWKTGFQELDDAFTQTQKEKLALAIKQMELEELYYDVKHDLEAKERVIETLNQQLEQCQQQTKMDM